MLGLDFLRENHAILDVRNHRIFIKALDTKSTIPSEIIKNILRQKEYNLIQLKRSMSGHQTLQVKINDEKPVHFMLDAGVSPSVMLYYQYAKNILGKISSSNALMKIFKDRINKLST